VPRSKKPEQVITSRLHNGGGSDIITVTMTVLGSRIVAAWVPSFIMR